MTIQLKVPSMVCDGCVDTVTKAVQSIDAVEKVNVDLGTKQVTIEGQPNEDQVKQAITAAGHTVE
ncbi:MAG: heavy-metal-associated domain-containing protein [Microcoleaceae cyanobacterium]